MRLVNHLRSQNGAIRKAIMAVVRRGTREETSHSQSALLQKRGKNLCKKKHYHMNAGIGFFQMSISFLKDILNKAPTLLVPCLSLT